jgi:MYXO-CTERM domain-containing protein
MKLTSVFAGAVGGLFLATTASASLQSLSMELVNTGDQGTTYRLFANLDAGARIDAVYGNSVGTLSIGTANGATMYQNANGGPTSKEINSNFFPFVPSMDWDSYVSIGAYYQNGAPFGENNLNNIGIDWSSFEGGGNLETDNGSWFVTPEDAQGNELNGQVFLGQFTVQGGLGSADDLVGQINVQGKDANGDTFNAIGAMWNTPVPAPGALALLGLAGLASSRRRRG